MLCDEPREMTMFLSQRYLARTVAGFCAIALVAGSVMAQPQRGDGQRDEGHRGDRQRVERGHNEGQRVDGRIANGRRGDVQRGSARGGQPPARWVDSAHGHNHVYPAQGRYVRVLPPQARPFAWHGTNYRYYNNVWYGPGTGGWVVVRPPYGAIVPWRPALFTVVTVAGLAYLYANGTYYREYPAGGYEVVAPPIEQPPAAALPVAQGTFVYPRKGQSAQRVRGNAQRL